MMRDRMAVIRKTPKTEKSPAAALHRRTAGWRCITNLQGVQIIGTAIAPAFEALPRLQTPVRRWKSCLVHDFAPCIRERDVRPRHQRCQTKNRGSGNRMFQAHRGIDLVFNFALPDVAETERDDWGKSRLRCWSITPVGTMSTT